LRLGPVELIVTDLERAIRFYELTVGLGLASREGGRARLGSGDADVLILDEQPDARQPGRHAGLYHVALLYPSREELARAATRLATTQTPIQGASDHGTHEAIYLADPDGNGLELAADRARDQWPTVDEIYAHGPAPLDLNGLLAAVSSEDPSPSAAPGLRVGHLHLQVGDVDEALAFYRDAIGFELQARLPSAAFVSAGGYHHHLGFNTWLGEGIPALPEGTVGLRHWTVVLPTSDDMKAVSARLAGAGVATAPVEGGFEARDSWQIALRVVSA
jgi:catechol 2,3-dioxygenase